MPVKIVSTATLSKEGMINENDLKIMLEQFEKESEVVPSSNRGPITKKLGWYVTRKEVEALFASNLDSDGNQAVLLEINFAINNDSITDVCDNSIANQLTVILRAKTNEKRPLNESEEFVLIPGFDNFPIDGSKMKSLFGTGCCPSSRP